MINYKMSCLMDIPADEISMFEAIKTSGMNYENLLAEVEKIKQIANTFELPSILIRGDTFKIPKEIERRWLDLVFEKREVECIYSEQERQWMIYLLVFMGNEEYSVFHFQEFFMVSKNTILSDLRKLREQLSQSELSLDYSRKKGFVLSGVELVIRSVAYQTVSNLIGCEHGERLLTKGLFTKNKSFYATVRKHFSKTIREFDLVFVPIRFEEMAYFNAYLLGRSEVHEICIADKDRKLLQQLLVYKASSCFLSNFSTIKNVDMECDYFTIIFMTVIQGETEDKSLEFLLECASDIIHEVERLAAIEFRNYRKLLLALFYHLVPAYFRIRFQLSFSNVLIDEIKMQYSEIFEITKLALLPLKRLVEVSIPDDEIGYFSILFGGEIRNQKERKQEAQLKAAILCPSGISSSLIMKSELQELFPQIDFREAHSVESFTSQEWETEFDMIFSSVPIDTKKKLYVINPIMTQLEKNGLMATVQNDFLFPRTKIPSVKEIIDLILPYVDLKKGNSKEKLYNIVKRKINTEMKRREDNRPMLSELLTLDMIQLSDATMSWEEAIELAAKPMKDTGKIEDSYIVAMINKVKDYGPFIHIGKGVALPHARPEDGVNQLGMSLLKVEKPVLLLDDEKHAIQVFICLAAIDNEVHLKALASLTRILSNKEKLDALLSASSKEEIYNIIRDGGEEE